MMTRSDIEQLSQKGFNAYFEMSSDERSRESHLMTIRMTSGSTGAPLILLQKLPAVKVVEIRDYAKTLVCHGSRPVRVSCHMTRHEYDSGSILSVDATDLRESLAPILEDFRAEQIFGFPSFIVRVGKYMSNDAKYAVQRVFCIGERVSPLLENVLTKMFPNAHIRQRYSSNETMAIGSMCKYLPLNQYHPSKTAEINIVNVDQAGKGDLVITKPLWPDILLDQYKIGDLAKYITNDCNCGNDITFEHLGRNGRDYVRLGGVIIFADVLERLLLSTQIEFSDYRLEVFMSEVEGGLRGNLRLKLQINTGVESFDQIIFSVTSVLLRMQMTRTKTLGDLIKQREFEPITIDIQSESFRSSAKEPRLAVVEI